MDKLCAGSRALAFLVAIVAAFATIPQLATVLLVLGGVSAIANKPEDNVRVYLVATVFTVGAKSLGGLIAVGAYLGAIFANVGTAAMGAAVTTAIGVARPPGCLGVHVNMPLANPLPEDLKNPTPAEQASIAALQYYQDKDSGYSKQQATRPQTLGYGLVDSPAGQAAWIYEKMWAWTDNRGTPEDALTPDEMLDNIMLYWLPGAGASSARLYWESFGAFGGSTKLELPVGVSIYPKEIFRPSRRWAERRMSNIIHWNELDKGGHFAAWEQPDIFVNELRDCFRKLR